MKRILNNFYVNFVALLGLGLSTVLILVSQGGGFVWGSVGVANLIGFCLLVGRLHRINRSMPKG